ncbi:MAG: Do family serine endopeptidase [Alphaproteobacteria bacterium]|nr:Do family serine endopeptidase [Alphaproteobacteria bacterium]
MSRLHRLVFLIGLVAALPAAAQQPATRPPSGREEIHLSFAPVVKQVAPAVVNVYSRRVVQTRAPVFNDALLRRFFGNAFPLVVPRQRVLNSLGSGVILDPSGLIVTNDHVIKDAEEISVVLSDRREFPAKVLLADEHLDLAVLKIGVPGEKLPVLPIGDSDRLEVGDLVLAVGNPFGVGQTVTSGIVSGLARTGTGISEFGSFIQTDAPINPGNSGGALVDMDGKLVGINTAIFSESGGSIGIGFAIPTGLVQSVLYAAQHGEHVVKQPWFGLEGKGVGADEARKLGLPRLGGVLVEDVAADSPAAKAGIRKGDVVLAVDGHDIEDAEALRFRLATHRIDSTAQFTLWHDGRTHMIMVTLVAPPEQPPRDITLLTGHHPLAGASVGNLNPAFADELNLPQNRRGVVISAFEPNSTAARLGLQRGDVLLSLDRHRIDDVAQLRSMLAGSEPPWTLDIERGDKTFTFVVR